MSDFINYIENFNNSCFDHDKKEVFIASHQNIISDLYKLLTDDLLLQYKQLKSRLLLQTVKDYQKKFKISDCEIEFFYSDIIEELKEGNKIHYLGNHIINLFNGEKGARRFRNYLSKHMHELGADTKVFELAYKAMKEV